MNRRERKEQLRTIVSDNVRRTCIYTRRPCVCVVLHSTDGETNRLRGIGFAKVCYPDRWDEAYGVSIAREKAIMDIVRQIMAKEEVG